MTTYSISLDDVDLALLPARAGGYNNFLRREHYEFQVLAREDEDSLHASHPCHICAIDVPAAFWSEHSAGAKHRANARIATAATQRISALITATLPPPLQPSGKFCDSCTVITGKDHEKTKEHRISVIQDRMLCDLATIYTGEDVDAEEMKGHLANGPVKNDNKDIKLDVKEASVDADNNMPKTELNAVNNNKANTARVLEDNITSMKAELPKEEAVRKAELPKVNTNKIVNETYIKLLNLPSIPKIQIQTSDNGILILINNEKINVLPDNFHGYHRFGSKIQCRPCCCTIDATEAETHKLSMIHMKRIMHVVDDSHCIRKTFANWSHCILCNLVITDNLVDSHKRSMVHRERKAECTVPQGQTTEDVTKVSKPTGSKASKEEHQPNQNEPNVTLNGGAGAKTAGVETKATAAQNNNAGPSILKNPPNQNGHVYKSNNMTVYKSKEDSKIEYPYKATASPLSVYCVLCRCQVPNNPSNRADHLKGARHVSSMKSTKQ